MEERFSKEKGGAREDLISKLPNSLISQILSSLETKEAVRTSVLSQRWKSLWLSIPKLDLASFEFPDYSAFVRFMDRFLDVAREEKSCLYKLKLRVIKDIENDMPCVRRWIDFAATPKLKHLDVEFGPVKPECLEVMPVSLYICETLLHLRLHRVSLGKFECVSLPCLKTLRLELNVYANEAGPESLISSCPVLEELSIVTRVFDEVKVLRVQSKTLTSLNIEQGDQDYEIEGVVEDYESEQDSGVLINAPKLEYLNLEGDIFKFKSMSKCDSLTKVNILAILGLDDDEARNFFNCISGVVDMKIRYPTFEFIGYGLPFSPQFYNLSCLEVELHFWSVKGLRKLLICCPNLKSLILDLLYCSGEKRIKVSSAPQCLLTSLEFVEIKSIFCGEPFEKELVRYFLENSVILTKLVLHLGGSMLHSVVLREIFALPRRSTTCEIVVCP